MTEKRDTNPLTQLMDRLRADDTGPQPITRDERIDRLYGIIDDYDAVTETLHERLTDLEQRVDELEASEKK